MANEKVGTHEAKTHLSEYLNPVRYGGERIIIEHHGKPVAALVSTEDLARLEEGANKSAEERYREALEEAGVRVRWTRDVGETTERVPRKRRIVKAKGIPLSEQVIRDRR